MDDRGARIRKASHVRVRTAFRLPTYSRRVEQTFSFLYAVRLLTAQETSNLQLLNFQLRKRTVVSLQRVSNSLARTHTLAVLRV